MEEKNWEKFKLESKERKNKNLHLELEKFNYDLNFAIRIIARSLRISRKRFGYAGLKDKRAITAQRISILNPEVEKLAEQREQARKKKDWKLADALRSKIRELGFSIADTEKGYKLGKI